MQADFILFMRSQLLDDPLGTKSWFPETLLHIRDHSGPFEVFARSRSTSYLNRAEVLLGIASKDEVERLLQALDAKPQRFPRWQFESFSPAHLLGLGKLATTP